MTPAVSPAVKDGVAYLLYDGDCAFCQRCVDLVRRLPVTCRVAPWQQADLPAFGITPAQAADKVQWVCPDGSVHSGALAVAWLLLACHGRFGAVYRTLGRVMLLPGVRQLAAVVYKLVADNRGRLPGGTAACALPPERRAS